VAALFGPTLTLVSAAPAGAADGATTTCRPHISVLPDLGGGGGVIASNGTVLVGEENPPGQPNDFRAAFWDHSGIHVIRTGLTHDFAGDINPQGEIVGAGDDPNTGLSRSWVWLGGHLHFLAGLSAGLPTLARRINQAGNIAGTGLDPHGKTVAVEWPSWSSHPVELLTPAGKVASFGNGINDQGTVAGETDFPSGAPSPVIWNAQHQVRILHTPAGFPYGFLRVENDRGEGAGDLFTPNGSAVSAGFWDATGTPHALGALPGDDLSEAFGMAANGWIVGDSLLVDHGNVLRGHVIFWPGHGPVLTLPGLTSYATTGSEAHGVNSQGTVLGATTDRHGVSRATVWYCAQAMAYRP
jgi:uncharacterized membrane protein